MRMAFERSKCAFARQRREGARPQAESGWYLVQGFIIARHTLYLSRCYVRSRCVTYTYFNPGFLPIRRETRAERLREHPTVADHQSVVVNQSQSDDLYVAPYAEMHHYRPSIPLLIYSLLFLIIPINYIAFMGPRRLLECLFFSSFRYLELFTRLFYALM